MTVTRAFCPTCSKTLYLGEADQAVCPVCVSPLATTAAEGDAGASDGERAVTIHLDEPVSRPRQVLQILNDWFMRYVRAGGEYSGEALMRAGEEASRARASGHTLDDSFQAGRDTYFRAIDEAST
ncbi:MAG: hypothetical protein ABR575_07460 [Actinomycetota bacterium]